MWGYAVDQSEDAMAGGSLAREMVRAPGSRCEKSCMQDPGKSPQPKVRISFRLSGGPDLSTDTAAGELWSLSLFGRFLRCVHSATRGEGEGEYTDTSHKRRVSGMRWKTVDARSGASIAQCYGVNLPISPFQRGDMRVIARPVQGRIHSIKTSRSNVLVSV